MPTPQVWHTPLNYSFYRKGRVRAKPGLENANDAYRYKKYMQPAKPI